MKPDRFDEGRFEFGESVRVTRNVRNDGTYPGMDVGTLLIRRGSVGNVIEVYFKWSSFRFFWKTIGSSWSLVIACCPYSEYPDRRYRR